ncbi:MAG: DEAD/DEAH box helicase, partial [Deltaproteobacteria bacterium]|nr:DEAD/DEAH box helicase [Deltaproteobacteria bacterium]
EVDLQLHHALPSVFPWDSLHKHQELALRGALDNRHLVVATGTGSGKTEAFLLPIADHCLKLRDGGAADGVAAVIVYPMNALADDQLRRLRPLLAGTRITFGRYTGVTPEETPDDIERMPESRLHTAAEKALLADGKDDQVPRPWEECPSRADIRERKPRILLTNYAQLEYLLLRDKDLDLFRRAPLRFLVFDEVHTYTGALGSEVACLVRRLRRVARKSVDEVLCIGTSATVQDRNDELDARGATVDFTHRLFGVPSDRIELVTEHYAALVPPAGAAYRPAAPPHPRKLLEELLEAVRDVQLRDEVDEIPAPAQAVAERLTGRRAPPPPTRMESLRRLLGPNEMVRTLGTVFETPTLIGDALPELRRLGRDHVDDEDLVAEILAYLTLGALVHQDGEPLLRPKLHYFVQGLQGLAVTFDASCEPRVVFDPEAGQAEDGARIFPMVLCRSCGQHYLPLVCEPPRPAEQDHAVTVKSTRSPGRHEDLESDEAVVYTTDALVTRAEGGRKLSKGYLCRLCGTLHDTEVARCLEGKCGNEGPLVAVSVAPAPLKKCLACETAAKGYEEVVTPARSSEVADVTILAQSMLAAMPVEPLQKLLVFSDSRQDAAFQAGWMDERSRRFRLRHVLYETLASEPDRVWSLERLTDHVVERSLAQGILRAGKWDQENNLTRVRWFLLEEFASTGQRRNSLESLALAEVLIQGIEPEDAPRICEQWSGRLHVTPTELARVVRLILDYYRRRGMVSDPLLGRQWGDADPPVYKGLVHTHEHYRPQALVLEGSSRSGYVRNWLARNGRSAAQ